MAFSKKTKIVCTMGPATESDDVLRSLIESGMNVARFNFSHGSHDYHRQMIERVRRISAELSIPVAIMLDTTGPEVRTGLLEDGKKVTVNTGDAIVVTAQPTSEDFHGNAGHISLDYLNLPRSRRAPSSSSTMALSALRSTTWRAPTSTVWSPTAARLARRRASTFPT